MNGVYFFWKLFFVIYKWRNEPKYWGGNIYKYINVKNIKWSERVKYQKNTARDPNPSSPSRAEFGTKMGKTTRSIRDSGPRRVKWQILKKVEGSGGELIYCIKPFCRLTIPIFRCLESHLFVTLLLTLSRFLWHGRDNIYNFGRPCPNALTATLMTAGSPHWPKTAQNVPK